MIKKKPLLISIAACIASYLLIEFVPSYDFLGYAWFPYLHCFNAAVILSWNVVLYFFIARLMTFKPVCFVRLRLPRVRCRIQYSSFAYIPHGACSAYR